MRLSRALLSLTVFASKSLSKASVLASNETAFVISNQGGEVRQQQQSITQTKTFQTTRNASSSSSSESSRHMTVDPQYPGTAVERMLAVRERVSRLTQDELNGRWEDVRRRILWAGGLRDLPNSMPGQGYTGHSFNDYNHVDLTCMIDNVSDSEHDGTSIPGIARGNRLGPGIRIASLPELGPGGSWSTCAMGCHKEPPQDVAHVQFQSRIAFKLVWVPNANFDTFVLVDDDGKELARGKPLEGLPRLSERQMNYKIVKGGKYARVVEEIAKNIAAE
jgi:hypothetical protein